MEKIYKAREGSRVPKHKAQSYGEYLQWLKESVGEEGLKPEYIVKKAKSKKSPIHDFFEWDDSRAALEHRLEQARNLVRSITVVVKYEEKTEETRAFQHIITVTEDGDEDKGYRSLEEIQANVSFQEAIVERARREYKGWLFRYKQYQKYEEFIPLSPIFDAMEEVEQKRTAALC